MRVVIDLFEAIPDIWDEATPNEKEIFKTITDYFTQRFSPLKEKMEAEEETSNQHQKQ